jgi:hypothetical protein
VKTLQDTQHEDKQGMTKYTKLIKVRTPATSRRDCSYQSTPTSFPPTPSYFTVLALRQPIKTKGACQSTQVSNSLPKQRLEEAFNDPKPPKNAEPGASTNGTIYKSTIAKNYGDDD